jgi:hypothetical protein
MKALLILLAVSVAWVEVSTTSQPGKEGHPKGKPEPPKPKAQPAIKKPPILVERPAPGGWTDVEVGSKEAVEIASKVLDELQDRSNQHQNYRLLGIESARKQVVSGINYELTLSYDLTGCPEEHFNYHNQAACPGHSGARCRVSFYEQVWTDTAEVTGLACVPLEAPVASPHHQARSFKKMEA